MNNFEIHFSNGVVVGGTFESLIIEGNIIKFYDNRKLSLLVNVDKVEFVNLVADGRIPGTAEE